MLPRQIKVATSSLKANCLFYLDLVSDLVICNYMKKFHACVDQHTHFITPTETGKSMMLRQGVG